MNEYRQYAEKILGDINASPTAFHAVDTMRQRLISNGFVELDEKQQWSLQAQGKYFVTRNQSSLIAFVQGQQDALATGVRILGAHTDSPCLKVKPVPVVTRKNYLQLAVEVYGGVLLHPWFDRDLALAGRISFVDAAGRVDSRLLNIDKAIGIIPSLAIHLDREANTKHTVNPQLHLPVVVSLDEALDFEALLKQQLKQAYPEIDISNVIEFELSFYDHQPGAFVGLNQELLSSARLDNLLSCFIGVQSLLAANGSATSMLVCTDHEEVGSVSACGAQGPFLKSVLERIYKDQESLTRVLDQSMLISVDNAHAVHPNYMNKHEPEHMPMMNHGPVLKMNVNQRYASNSETQAVFAHCCERAEVPLQKFVTRTDLGCGSTIGPLTASNIGIATVDVGIPSLAMHSIRETAAAKDLHNMHKALTTFLNMEKLWAD